MITPTASTSIPPISVEAELTLDNFVALKNYLQERSPLNMSDVLNQALAAFLPAQSEASEPAQRVNDWQLGLEAFHEDLEVWND